LNSIDSTALLLLTDVIRYEKGEVEKSGAMRAT
jgi:hypothetical protein